MEDNGEDESYLADDFDDVPDNAWDELERSAIQLTQHPQNQNHKQETAVKQISYPPAVAHQHAGARIVPGQSIQPSADLRLQENEYAPRPLYRQAVVNGAYEDADVPTPAEDQEVFLVENRREGMKQGARWTGQQYGSTRRPMEPPATMHEQPYREHCAEHQLDEHNLEMDVDDRTVSNPFNEPTLNQEHHYAPAEVLQAQIAELRRERDDLARKLQTANTTVMTQQGEIAIIRANQAKGNEAFDRQLVAIKKSIQEDAAKHRVDIEATNKLRETVATENQFLKHELKAEGEKTRALQMSLKEKEGRMAKADSAEIVTTPKKARQLPFRDGFDEDDFAPVSPVKAGRKSKGGTPTNAGKKKRKVPDGSPVPALTFHQPFAARPKSLGPPKEDSIDTSGKILVIPKDPRGQKSLLFMQRMLDHRVTSDKDRILEHFSQYAFPSDTKKSFTSIVLEESATLSGVTLPSGFTKIMIALWAQALKEKYYKPVAALIEIVEYITAIERSVINSDIIAMIIPVLQSSTEVNGAVRFRNSPVSHQNFGESKQTPKSELNDDVDGTATLSMLYAIACSCIRKPKLMEVFWRTTDSNFFLMMLNVAQPITDLILTLKLLSTSIMPSTFGTIMSNETDQQGIEGYLINRVAYLLWETPRVDEGVPSPTQDETYQLRMEALSLLSELALTSPLLPGSSVRHGSLLLATDRSLIGRLVRFLYDTVDALYSPIEPSSSLHTLVSFLINRSTLLLYRLLQTHGRDINLHDKLTAVRGGVQLHRVVLTRLAFSEGLYLESGITDQTAAMAHEMLDDAVTPEEGEALLEVFPGSIGRAGDGTGPT